MPDQTPYDSAMEEAEGNAVETLIENMQEENITDDSIVTAMRQHIPNLEDVDDKQVIELYRSGGKAAEAGAEGSSGEAANEAGQAPWAPSGYNFTDKEGKDLALTPEILSFLENAGVNYRALGADHRKSFSDVVRNASRGHLNSKQTDELNRQVAELTTSGDLSGKEVKELQTQLDKWDQILQAAAASNGQPFVDVVNRYKEAIGTSPTGMSEAEVKAQEIVDNEADRATQERGMNEYVRPRLAEVAKTFNITDTENLEKWAVNRIGELENVNTPEQIKFWFENTMLQELDDLNLEATAGQPALTPEAPAVVTDNTELTNLKNEIAQLKAAAGAPASGGADEGIVEASDVGKGIDKMTTKEMWAALKRRG